MNISAYTGKPYNFRAYNCWHHVRAVRKDVGLETPEFNVMSPRDINQAFEDGHAATKGLEQVFTPQNYDAVLMGVKTGGRIVWHAGVYFEGMVSHCAMYARQVKLDLLSDLKQVYQEIEFWR